MPRVAPGRVRKRADATRTRPKARTQSFASSSRPITRPSTIADDPGIVEAERQLNDALDELVAIGALKPENRMSVEEYINLDEELEQSVRDVSDEETKKKKKAREGKDGGNDEAGKEDDESESNGSVEPVPTRVEALRAALLLQRYLLYWNDPYAHELWSTLNSFGQKSRARERMENSKITDFFSRK